MDASASSAAMTAFISTRQLAIASRSRRARRHFCIQRRQPFCFRSRLRLGQETIQRRLNLRAADAEIGQILFFHGS